MKQRRAGRGRASPSPEAVEAALASEDVEAAVVLVERAAEDVFLGASRVSLDRLGSWLERLRPQVHERPWLLYYQSRVWTAQRRQALAAVALAKAERLFLQQVASPKRARSIALVKLAQGVVAERDGNYQRAREAFQAARRLLGQPGQAEPWIESGDAERWRARDPSGAAAFYLEAIPALRTAGEPLQLARCLNNFALELLRRGEPRGARRAASESVDLKRGLDGDSSLANSLNTLGMAEHELGAYDLARRTLGEAIEHADAAGYRLIRAYAVNNLAEVERDAGNTAAAEELYAGSLREKELLRDDHGLAYSLRSQAVLKRRAGDLAAARALIRRAVALREPISEPHEAAQMRLEEGLVAAGFGEMPAARALLEEARFLADETGAGALDAVAAIALATIARRPAEAERTLAESAGHGLDALLRLETDWLRTTVPSRSTAGGASGLRAWVLGEFRLEIGGNVVEFANWRSKRAAELVRILIAQRQRGVHRDELLEWLWPGSSAAGPNLNAAVNAARRGLEEGGSAGLLARGGDRYRLGPLEWCDADALVSSLSSALAAEEAGDLPRALRELRAAHELLRGDPYPADRYAEWSVAERARLTETAQLVRETLARVATRLGHHEDAILVATEAIAAEPCRESAHQLLIRAHLGRGDGASAQRALDNCRETLAQELGVKPSLETERLLAV